MVSTRYHQLMKNASDNDERLYELLLRLGRLVQAGERQAGAPLLPVQLNALHFLRRANRYSNTPRAVAEYLGVTKGTASQTVRALEQRGLVERRTDEDDRRVQRLVVTKDGRRLLRRVLPPVVLRGAAEDLGGERASRLENDLTELLRSLQRSQDGRAFGICGTCRHHQSTGKSGRSVCGLTGEPLRRAEAHLLCREHEPAESP